MSYNNNNDNIRMFSVNKLDKFINNIYLSKIIERDIYNYIIEVSKSNQYKRSWDNKVFKQLYLNKIISIYTNLDKNNYVNNNYLLDAIKNNKIKNICKINVTALHPEVWKPLLNKKSKIDRLKYSIKPEAMTSLFKCRKCGSNSTSYYEVQTRSADEPMTQFVTCLKCNARWKQ
tara:strand:+ start:2869 stop:3390 length:522 start_codon:yes stop_codon:yes gene_type:complete